MEERRGIDITQNYALIRGICARYFKASAERSSIEFDDYVQQVMLAITVRNQGKCPYRPKQGYSCKPYVYRVAWQTLGRMQRKRRRWYQITLSDDHGRLCQIATAQGFTDDVHPLGALLDEHRAHKAIERKKKKREKERGKMRRLRARRGTVLVSMLTQDTSEDGKHYQDPATGLFMGREVHQPIGVVISSGVDAIKPGTKVVVICDLGDQYEHQGMKIQLARVFKSCGCGRSILANDEVAAVKVDGKWTDPPGRRVLIPQPKASASELVEGVSEDNTPPEGLHEPTGELVLYSNERAFSFSDDEKPHVSVRDVVTCKCGRTKSGDLLAVKQKGTQCTGEDVKTP